MKNIMRTTAALALLATLAAGPVVARDESWIAEKGNTRGWELMTHEERLEHQDKMRNFRTHEECVAYQQEHHAQMEARAKEKGLTTRMFERRPNGCDYMRARGFIK